MNGAFPEFVGKKQACSTRIFSSSIRNYQLLFCCQKLNQIQEYFVHILKFQKKKIKIKKKKVLIIYVTCQVRK